MREDELFSVIVADDEEELREAVCGLIDWEGIGFRLLGSAGNGLDALQMVEQLQPDLLLTDIHMPFISGTSLARQVRELQPLIQIAFLSGYDDFEYARAAIDCDVIAYLLKPISMEELTKALRDIHEKLEAKFSDFAGGGDGAGALRLAAASLLLDGCAGEQSEERLRESLAELGLVTTAPYELTVLAARLPGGLPPGQRAAQIADRVLKKYFGSCSFVSGERILSLLVSEVGFSRLGTALDELLYMLRRLLGSAPAIGVSRKFDRFTRCHSACREAVDAQRFSSGEGVHKIGEMIQDRAGDREREDSAEELEKLLQSGSRPALEKYLGELFGRAGGGQIGLLRVLVTAQNLLEGALPPGQAALLLRRCGLDKPLDEGLGPEELQRRTADLCLAGQSLLSESRRDGVSLLCERTMKIIEQEYMDEGLSLGSVSERLHVSPNYLSANMKKHAGDTFINLLIKRRMEAARGLLGAGNMKIAELARRCGYADQHYFSYCFKKYYGVSPAKMRRENGGESRE